MKSVVRALFLLAALDLGAGLGSALAQSGDVKEPVSEKPVEVKKPEDDGKASAVKKPEDEGKAADAKKPEEDGKPADAVKPEEARKAEDTKKPEETKKAGDGKKPKEAKKPAESAKSPKFTKSTEIYLSSTTFLGTKLAVGGYDTVAYHKEGKPVIGTEAFTHTWKDATWRFSSKENLDAFVADPDKYAPQYGGHCAFAVAHNALSPGNPQHWKIVDGKLYLNIDGSVHTKWERGQDGLLKRSEAHWPKILPALQPKLAKK